MISVRCVGSDGSRYLRGTPHHHQRRNALRRRGCSNAEAKRSRAPHRCSTATPAVPSLVESACCSSSRTARAFRVPWAALRARRTLPPAPQRGASARGRVVHAPASRRGARGPVLGVLLDHGQVGVQRHAHRGVKGDLRAPPHRTPKMFAPVDALPLLWGPPDVACSPRAGAWRRCLARSTAIPPRLPPGRCALQSPPAPRAAPGGHRRCRPSLRTARSRARNPCPPHLAGRAHATAHPRPCRTRSAPPRAPPLPLNKHTWKAVRMYCVRTKGRSCLESTALATSMKSWL